MRRRQQPVQAQADAVHGIAQDHAEQRDRITRVEPGPGFKLSGDGKQGDDQCGHAHGRGADPIRPVASEAAVLAGDGLTLGEHHHDQGGQHREPGRLNGEQRLQDQPDHGQSHDHACRRDHQTTRQTQLENDRQAGVDQQQRRGQRQIPIIKDDIIHPPPPSSRDVGISITSPPSI